IALCDAPRAGNGKGLLVEVLALIHTGTAAALKPAPPRNEDEWRKILTSIISAGNQLTMFDNLDDVLKSPSLALAVTSETYSDRLLGRSAIITVPQRTLFVVHREQYHPRICQGAATVFGLTPRCRNR